MISIQEQTQNTTVKYDEQRSAHERISARKSKGRTNIQRTVHLKLMNKEKQLDSKRLKTSIEVTQRHSITKPRETTSKKIG